MGLDSTIYVQENDGTMREIAYWRKQPAIHACFGNTCETQITLTHIRALRVAIAELVAEDESLDEMRGEHAGVHWLWENFRNIEDHFFCGEAGDPPTPCNILIYRASW